MKKVILLITVLLITVAKAQDPIFDPSMAITEYGIVDSPIGEEVDKIIDGDFNTKFLDFELDDGMGFTVDLGGLSFIANSIEITTANDFEVRDPTQFEVLGSNDGTTFTSIAIGDIPCIPDRFFTRVFDFVNSESYMYYRINYTDACDPTGGTGIPSIQLAETQLYQTVLGMDDDRFSSMIRLFPNPSNGIINMNYSGSDPLTDAIMTDISGKIIKEIDLSDFNGYHQIHLSDLVSGIYFMKISSEEISTTKKILIR